MSKLFISYNYVANSSLKQISTSHGFGNIVYDEGHPLNSYSDIEKIERDAEEHLAKKYHANPEDVNVVIINWKIMEDSTDE